MYRREKVNGYEEYEVDTNGVIYGKRGKPLKFSVNPKGYRIVVFSINGETKGFGVHQIVARQFIENDKPECKTQVNHIDGDKANNHVENLEWVTAKENMRHSVDVLGNYLEDKNWHARSICGVDIETHKIKYRFSSLIGAAKFFANDKNSRHIQTTLWKALNNIDTHKTYRKCLWFYEDECQYDLDEIMNVAEPYVIERGCRKLSEEDVKWIRDNYIPYDSEFGVRGLSRKFNVDHNVISKIINYKTYKDVI
jgi:hypothetical protein